MKIYAKWMWSQMMIQASFWSCLFFSAAFPHTHKYLITNISSKLISMETIVGGLGIIFIHSLFNKYSDFFFKRFKLLCVIECVVYGIGLPMVGCGWISASSYFVTDIICGALVCRAIFCGANRLRKLVYDREERERYDNCEPIARAAACLIGGALSMLPIPLWMAWSFIAVGCVIDDVFYWIIYNKVTK